MRKDANFARIRKSLESNHSDDGGKHISHADSNCYNKVNQAFDKETLTVVMK